MHCFGQACDEERQKRLLPQVRNEIVRDFVVQMFTFEPQPKKPFVTDVAKQLVKKYPFLKDVGQSVSGYVSFSFTRVTAYIIEYAPFYSCRVHGKISFLNEFTM